MTDTTTAPENLRVDYDLYEPVDRVNETVAELAKMGPLVWSSAHGGHWIVTRYAEAHEVLRDAETFSSYPNNLVLKDVGPPMIPVESDPPDHGAYRKALQTLFSPNRMKAIEGQIRDVVNELIDGFAARGEAEFVAEFAHELPARVFLALMGWPHDDAPMFTDATDAILLGKPGGSDEESNQARVQAQQQLFGYFAEVVRDRRDNPAGQGDITESIITTPVDFPDGERLLTDDELHNMFFLLLIAGLHTVQGTLAWSIIHLAAHPDQRQMIVDDLSLIPDTVEEMLRFEAAVSMGRRVTRDTVLGGQQLRAGDQLLVILAGANRDAEEFDAPDDLQIDRTPNRHLAFGAGAHRCIGSHLARIELRISLEEIHRRIPDYAVNPDRPVQSHGGSVRGVVQLPILFSPEG